MTRLTCLSVFQSVSELIVILFSTFVCICMNGCVCLCVSVCGDCSQFTISGFSSVYFEAMLKNKEESISIWERNFQLAFYSVLFLGLSSYVKRQYDAMSGNVVSNPADFAYTPFRGWSEYSAALCVLNAVAGLLVAATLKYADAVLKCFATSVSIIITSVLSYQLLGSSIDAVAALGMITTVLSIFNYALDT